MNNKMNINTYKELSNFNNNIKNFYKHYSLFYTNLNESLKKELGLNYENNDNEENNKWVPPTEYGLNNSKRIITEHYVCKDKNFNEIDMFNELKKDIRNFRPLEKIQLDYIKTLNNEQILELINIYNECLISVNYIIDKS